MSKLKDISDKELKQELIAREADRRAIQNKCRNDNAAFVLANIDALVQLVTTHDTINCSDANLASAYNDHNRPRCRRCRLLEIQRQQFNDCTILDISLFNMETLDNANIRVKVE
jgi:hypothetical protein